LLPGTCEREGTTLPLGRLDRTATHDFLQEVSDGASDEVASAVFRVTEGHPRFLVELVRLLKAGGGPQGELGTSHLVIPFGVREAIRQRLATLLPELTVALEIASVLDPSISVGLLADVGRIEEDEAALLLTGLVDRQVLRRHELHALPGEALRRRPDTGAAEIARHFSDAGARHRDRAVRYVLQSAEGAALLGAYGLTAIDRVLRPGGMLFLLEPATSSHLGDNIAHPFGPFLYTASVFHCTTVSLAQGGAGRGTAGGGEHPRGGCADWL
jgi:hypothetical protein